MQDVIPPHKRPRGHVTPGKRPGGFGVRPPSVYREVYSRTRIINSTTEYVLEPEVEEVVEESFRTPLPLSLQFELETLLADSAAEPEVTVIQQTRVFEGTKLSPEKELILKRVRQIVRQEQRKAKITGLFSKKNVLTALAILFISTTGYVAFDTWMTNNSVKAETAKLGGGSSNSVANSTGTASAEQEGRDETPVSQGALKSYSVSPDLPKKLYISKLRVASRVLPMSVNADGSVQAPRNIFDAGWYSGSVKPGEIGAMFIDAHASGPTREGLFAYLDKLVIGDTMQIEKGDGTRLTYRVVHTEVQPVDGLNMKQMLLPYGTTSRALNLMTCTGKWVAATNSYDKRVLVFTEQI